MGLWDLIPGKKIKFNLMRGESNSRVCKALQPFVTSRLHRYPGMEEVFTDARNHLYSFYSCAGSVFLYSIDNAIEKHKRAIMDLDAGGYLRLISSLHTGHIVSNYLRSADKSHAISWFNLQSEGICDMYGRPDSYMVDWIDSFEWLGDIDEAIASKLRGRPSRLETKMLNEIATELNINLQAIDPSAWLQVFQLCVSTAEERYEDSEWLKIIGKEIFAH
jgi:hypothetical protein